MVVLAACGGTGPSSAPTLPSLDDNNSGVDQTTPTTETANPEEAMREYSACMREHGVDLPDPSASGGAVSVGGGSESDFATFEGANTECAPLLEGVFDDFQLSPQQQAESRDQQLALAECMRGEGIDWPDPDPEGGLIAVEMGDDVDDEALNAAMQTCSEEVFGEAGAFGVSGAISQGRP